MLIIELKIFALFSAEWFVHKSRNNKLRLKIFKDDLIYTYHNLMIKINKIIIKSVLSMVLSLNPNGLFKNKGIYLPINITKFQKNQDVQHSQIESKFVKNL